MNNIMVEISDFYGNQKRLVFLYRLTVYDAMKSMGSSEEEAVYADSWAELACVGDEAEFGHFNLKILEI